MIELRISLQDQVITKKLKYKCYIQHPKFKKGFFHYFRKITVLGHFFVSVLCNFVFCTNYLLIIIIVCLFIFSRKKLKCSKASFFSWSRYKFYLCNCRGWQYGIQNFPFFAQLKKKKKKNKTNFTFYYCLMQFLGNKVTSRKGIYHRDFFVCFCC